jgi:hypothetical protein
MLSASVELPLLIKMFKSNEPSKNITANIVVDFVKKSDVLRTPNDVAIPEPPKLPESPVPFEDCNSTTAMSKIATITNNMIENNTILDVF